MPRKPPDKLTCKVCYRSPPEVTIALVNGKPRARHVCTECRRQAKAGSKALTKALDNPALEELSEANSKRLGRLSHGAYRLSFGSLLDDRAYEHGCIVLRPDYVWVSTYEGTYQYPAPYDMARIGRYLAYLHLIVTEKPFPMLSDDERKRLETSNHSGNIDVLGVY